MHGTRQETGGARLAGLRAQLESLRTPDGITHLVVLTGREKLAFAVNSRGGRRTRLTSRGLFLVTHSYRRLQTRDDYGWTITPTPYPGPLTHILARSYARLHRQSDTEYFQFQRALVCDETIKRTSQGGLSLFDPERNGKSSDTDAAAEHVAFNGANSTAFL